MAEGEIVTNESLDFVRRSWVRGLAEHPEAFPARFGNVRGLGAARRRVAAAGDYVRASLARWRRRRMSFTVVWRWGRLEDVQRHPLRGFIHWVVLVVGGGSVREREFQRRMRSHAFVIVGSAGLLQKTK